MSAQTAAFLLGLSLYPDVNYGSRTNTQCVRKLCETASIQKKLKGRDLFASLAGYGCV
jgi:hypothetical protein